MVGLHGVSKRFGAVEAVQDVTLTMARSGVYGLLGANGAGKTTTLRMLCGIIAPSVGRRLFGDAYKGRVGYMPEELAVYRGSTLEEHLRLFGRLRHVSPRDSALNVDALVAALGMSAELRKPLGVLSKGTVRKAQYICTVMHNPLLLVLDEPFSGLDPVAAHIIEEDIRKRCEAGCMALLSTHRIEQAERFCDHVFMLHRGRLVIDSELAALFDTARQQRYEVVTRIKLPRESGTFTFEGEERAGYRYTADVEKERAARSEFFKMLSQIDVVSVRAVHKGLNEIFLETVRA